jgi:hypothetical protein
VRFLVASARNSPKVQERGVARPRRRSVIGGVAKRDGLRAVDGTALGSGWPGVGLGFPRGALGHTWAVGRCRIILGGVTVASASATSVAGKLVLFEVHNPHASAATGQQKQPSGWRVPWWG